VLRAPSTTLRSLMVRAQNRDVRVAIGVCLALESFHNGRSPQKVASACSLFQEWLTQASSISFRLQSHKDEKRSWAELGDFVSDRIIANRKLFLATLGDIAKCCDRLDFFRALKDLSLKLLHPSLRLHVLQGILGLDETYDRDMVVDVLTLTLDLVQDMDGSVERERRYH